MVTANRLQRKRAEKAAKVKRGEATKTATKEYVTHQSLGCLPLAVFAPIHDPLCSPFTYPSLTLHFPFTFPPLSRHLPACFRYAKLKAERAKEEKAQRREKSSRRASSTGKSH